MGALQGGKLVVPTMHAVCMVMERTSFLLPQLYGVNFSLSF